MQYFIERDTEGVVVHLTRDDDEDYRFDDPKFVSLIETTPHPFVESIFQLVDIEGAVKRCKQTMILPPHFTVSVGVSIIDEEQCDIYLLMPDAIADALVEEDIVRTDYEYHYDDEDEDWVYTAIFENLDNLITASKVIKEDLDVYKCEEGYVITSEDDEFYNICELCKTSGWQYEYVIRQERPTWKKICNTKDLRKL